ncbi:MAG: YceI family protein [Nocardiopsaceae bacterium]|nr:YceI family protein [Nocardiopsaceae bacterium]
MADAIAGTFNLGPGSGRVLLKTGRTGAAAKMGHDLTIEVTQWSAEVTVPDDSGGGLEAATVSAELDLGSLEVREGTGGAKPLSDKDKRDIEKSAKKTLANVGKASFASSKIIPSGSGGAIEGTLTLNGKSQPARVQVVSADGGKYTGSATIRQTDFGITPFSAFLGALKLADDVGLEFEVNLA